MTPKHLDSHLSYVTIIQTAKQIFPRNQFTHWLEEIISFEKDKGRRSGDVVITSKAMKINLISYNNVL